jgi:hypothetical protein
MKRLLWLCTHRTQWREEVSLLLEAGFEVVPVHWGHREHPINENPDDPYFVQTWRQHCTLAPETINCLRAVNWFHEAPVELLPLAIDSFDGVVITSFLDTLLLVARWFPKDIFFRVFGQAGEFSYSRLAGPAVLRQLSQTACYQSGRYHWCPVLPTLSFIEEEILTRGQVLVDPFISLERLPFQWEAEKAEPYVALVLSRLVEIGYYHSLYRRIVSAFRSPELSIPLRVLGHNSVGGKGLGDPEIVGSLSDDEYLAMMARATAFFYQGESLCHLHWSGVEALAMGVPVVMMEIGFLAWALKQVVGPEARGEGYGVVQGLDHASKLLARCLEDPRIAAAIAFRQRPLARYFADRDLGAKQYRARFGAALGDSNRNEETLNLAYKLSA